MRSVSATLMRGPRNEFLHRLIDDKSRLHSSPPGSLSVNPCTNMEFLSGSTLSEASPSKGVMDPAPPRSESLCYANRPPIRNSFDLGHCLFSPHLLH